MTWDPLLADDWPTEWSPFTVVVRPDGDLIELIAEGYLDGWTVGALLRNLAAVYEWSFSEVHVDLTKVTGTDGTADRGVARCRDFATSRGVAFRLSPPEVLSPAPMPGWPAAIAAS